VGDSVVDLREFWRMEAADFRCHSAFLGVIVRLRVRFSSH
jgi:hypothetical protein